MKNFVLMHYGTFRLIISYLSYICMALLFIFFIPVCLGDLRLIRIQFKGLKRLRHASQSLEHQLISIADNFSALKTTIYAALELPSISDEERSEMLEMLKVAEIINRNAPLLPEFIEDYVDDLYTLNERLQEIVPPTLYHLNPEFIQTIPPGLTPVQWAKRNVRYNCLIPHLWGTIAFILLIHGIRHPWALNISFIPIVFLGFFTLALYRKLHKKRFLRDMDQDSLKCYQFGYRYVLVVLSVTLILYIIFRFLLFGI